MKAMILAAGRGARLSPLTDSTPKPLLQVHGKALIDWQLDKLIAAGFAEFVINVGYLGEQIQQHLDRNPREGVSIDISVEPQTALETAGGIVKALPLLGKGLVAIVNADVWTDFDFRRLKRLSAMNHKAAWHGHLVLAPNPAHNRKGDFGLSNGWVCTLEREQTHHNDSYRERRSFTFCGISVLDMQLFQHLEPGKFPLAPILTEAAANNLLSGELHTNHWIDIGSEERLNEINALKFPPHVRTKV